MPSACQATYNPLIISCKEGGQEGISLEEVGLRDICKGGGGGGGGGLISLYGGYHQGLACCLVFHLRRDWTLW